MIDNVIFLLTGTRHKRDMKEVSCAASASCGLWFSCMVELILRLGDSLCVSRVQLLPKCHPLGMFEEIGALTIASSPAELYNSVLKDTPLGPFMANCLKAPDLDELNIEIIRNTLYKEYVILRPPSECTVS